MRELMRTVEEPSGVQRRVFPFPIAGGHFKLFEDIAEYIV